MQPPSILPIWQCLCGAQGSPTNPFPRSWSFLQYNLPRPGHQKLLCTRTSLFSCVLCTAFIKPFSLAKQMAGREVWRGFESICPKRLLHLFSIYSSPCSKQNFVSFACVLSILYKSQWITSLWFSDIICTSIYQPSYVFFGVFDFLTSFAQAFINFHMSSLVSGHVLLKSEFTYGPCEVTGWWEPVYWDNTSFSLLSDLYAVPWTKYPTQWPSQLSRDIWRFRILKQLYFSLGFFSQSPLKTSSFVQGLLPLGS